MRMETKQLLLRQFDPKDAKEVHELFCDEGGKKMLDGLFKKEL